MKATKENLERHRAAASRLRKLCGERLLEGSFYSATRNGVTSFRLTDNRNGKCRAMHVPKGNAEEVRRWTQKRGNRGPVRRRAAAPGRWFGIRAA